MEDADGRDLSRNLARNLAQNLESSFGEYLTLLVQGLEQFNDRHLGHSALGRLMHYDEIKPKTSDVARPIDNEVIVMDIEKNSSQFPTIVLNSRTGDRSFYLDLKRVRTGLESRAEPALKSRERLGSETGLKPKTGPGAHVKARLGTDEGLEPLWNRN
ncbi:hypothetical protein EVAR_7423_1 [Eumeta japonica]|uniref:Uncharacterized protein n=1 Tax=Eumeta variegata TaxID=151549 RepID=A0A4C1V760_EUMVA|nr:hypothetical protein EVAR_7423_1 [Eumeta japonica]